MSKISDVTNQALRDLIGNMCLTKITLAATGGATATLASTGTFTFTNGGLILTHAALAAQSIVPTHSLNGKLAVTAARPLPTGKTAYFVLGVNAAGICVVQGDYAGENLSQYNMGTSSMGDGSVPDVPVGYTPIGAMKMVNTSVGDFIAGVTLLNVANLTATYTDLALMPASLA